MLGLWAGSALHTFRTPTAHWCCSFFKPFGDFPQSEAATKKCDREQSKISDSPNSYAEIGPIQLAQRENQKKGKNYRG